MGVGSNEFTSLGSFEVSYEVFQASPGDLYAITLFTPTDFIDSAEAYAEIGIGNNNSNISSRLLTLASGYVGTNKALFYSGSIPFNTDDYIFCLITSANAITWRLNYRIIPYTKVGLNNVKQ